MLKLNSSGKDTASLTAASIEDVKANANVCSETVDELTGNFSNLLSNKNEASEKSVFLNSNNNSIDGETQQQLYHGNDHSETEFIVGNNSNDVLVIETEETTESSLPLEMQFPVSSGQLHRRKENDWIPSSQRNEHVIYHCGFGHSNNNNNNCNVATTVMQQSPIQVSYPAQHNVMQPGMGSYIPSQQYHPTHLHSYGPGQMIGYPMHLQREQMYRGNTKQFRSPRRFHNYRQIGRGSNYEINSPCRFQGMKSFHYNTNDFESKMGINTAQQEVQPWIESESGQFTGTTGARVLSSSELASGNPAWARKDQLSSAAPVQSGMGMAMLQKMGWRPGEGLGKNREGPLEPPKMLLKMDKRGLVASDEVREPPSKDVAKNFYEGKHPVSLLNEVCLRNHYGAPMFDCCFEIGPNQKTNFVFKVTVNGVQYKPEVASQTKKQAKVEAATLCLRELGLIS